METTLSKRNPESDWAVILGASSGFGGATARRLAKDGFNIFGFHLDRRNTMDAVEDTISAIEGHGQQALFFNANAADDDVRSQAIRDIIDFLGAEDFSGKVKVMLHSLAFGNLRSYVATDTEDSISPSQMDMTFTVMSHTLVYWARDLVEAGLMDDGGRIFAMTSAGSHRIWPHYGAVSAVKATLDTHVRRLAYELAPRGITVNSIRAGVTDTPALKKIPGNLDLLDIARKNNPSGRLTTPEDVAEAISLLVDDRSYWITGNIIGVDGGEDVVG
tara:strand:- start:2303 stop:3124 length:822 start_codon:yes stop_codon:yes gene_type:complete